MPKVQKMIGVPENRSITTRPVRRFILHVLCKVLAPDAKKEFLKFFLSCLRVGPVQHGCSDRVQFVRA